MAANATEAGEPSLLASSEFLGVVSDMRMPGRVDGAQVHAWVSRNRPELASHFVFMTGDIANDETLATLRKTGVPCLEKPFGVSRLISVVEKAIGNPRRALPEECPCCGEVSQALSVTLDMSRIHPECPDLDPSDRSVAAGVFLRQEPDEEQDEEEDEDDGKEDDNDNSDDGYSE